tara:strand:+ start:69 stop:593 length:525 start_codon:yes stop_codon:yes gene_type:complete
MGISHQSRLDCAAEVNYPACLIQETAGDDVCEVVPSTQVSDLYNTCLGIKHQNMMANICPLPGETHDGYGNCIPSVVYAQPVEPTPTLTTGYLINTEAPLNLAPQERTPLQEAGDWLTARQGDIASIITPKPNPPCRDGGINQCHLDWQAELKKSKDIVKWVAIGLVAYMLITK